MKVIPALMSMALHAVAAPSAPSDPGQIAVSFLEKVREQSINLEPGTDTALAPQTSESKREEIARRLERMAKDLGKDPLEVGPVKLDGDLAGVLVRKISNFDPSRMQVFPIALVNRNGAWTAAPVPASFENSGVGYAAGIRKRLKALEDWMLREQVLDLATLREQATEIMRQKIEACLPLKTLQSFSSQQAVQRFLTACETRNLPEMFGLLGGLETHPTSDWPLRIKAAERAVNAGTELTGPWRLLISSDVLRTIVHHEQDDRSALVSLACLDPAGNLPPGARPRVRLVHLDLSKSKDGLWRVNPPEFFFDQSGLPADDEDLDADLLDAFPIEIRKACPASPLPTPDEARHAVMTGLQNGALSSLIRMIRLDGKPKAARDTCVRAAETWWSLREPSSARLAVPLGMHENEDHAAATYQIFSARNPDRFDFNVLYFERSTDGWMWAPKPSAATVEYFKKWTDLQSAQWQDQWRDNLIAECPVVEAYSGTEAPPEKESRELIQSWNQALSAGDVTGALRLIARLNLPDSKVTLLRNLGYELTGARRAKQIPEVTGVFSKGAWTGVGVQVNPSKNTSFPFLPVISTPSGPRILVEIDLSASGKGRRDFLNNTAFKRLATFSPAAAGELKELFSQHQTEVTAPATPRQPETP